MQRAGSHQFITPAWLRLKENFDDSGGLRLDDPSRWRDGILLGVGSFQLEAHSASRVRVPEAQRALQLLPSLKLESKIAWRDKKQSLRHLSAAKLRLVILRHKLGVL